MKLTGREGGESLADRVKRIMSNTHTPEYVWVPYYYVMILYTRTAVYENTGYVYGMYGWYGCESATAVVLGRITRVTGGVQGDFCNNCIGRCMAACVFETERKRSAHSARIIRFSRCG